MVISASMGETNKVIQCPVCANPALRPGITVNEDTITIDEVKDTDFVNYTCRAENEIVGSWKSKGFLIEVTKKGRHKFINQGQLYNNKYSGEWFTVHCCLHKSQEACIHQQ